MAGCLVRSWDAGGGEAKEKRSQNSDEEFSHAKKKKNTADILQRAESASLLLIYNDLTSNLKFPFPD